METLAQQAKALGLHIDLSYKFHDPGRFGGVKDPKLIEGTVKGLRRKSGRMTAPPRIVSAALIALMLTIPKLPGCSSCAICSAPSPANSIDRRSAFRTSRTCNCSLR